MPVLSSYVCDHAALPRISVNANFSIPLKYLASEDNRPYSANAHADTGGKYQLLALAFRTAATVIKKLFLSLLLGFQVTVISKYSRLVCVGDRKLSCKQQKYIRGDNGRCLQKRSGTAEGMQAHWRTYCKDSARWAISWNAHI